MPIKRSAKKKMRQDEKRRLKNLRIKREYKEAVKAIRRNQDEKKLKKAYSALDRAAKKGIIKKNKASRLKSRLSKLPNKK